VANQSLSRRISDDDLHSLPSILRCIPDGGNIRVHAISAKAIEELIDFREGVNGPLRVLERSLAYECASTNLTSFCMTGSFSEDGEWYDTSNVCEGCEQDVKDAVLYLELRSLLLRHPTELNFVSIRDESEAL